MSASFDDDLDPTIRRSPDVFDALVEVLLTDFRRLFPRLRVEDCFHVERVADADSGKIWIEYEVLRGVRRYWERTTLFIESGRVARRQHEARPLNESENSSQVN